MLSGQLKKVKPLKMKTLIPAVLVACFALPAIAADQYNDRGRVLSVTPQTERVNVPRQECRTEYQQQTSQHQEHSMTGSVLGGIAGGLLGSTIGRGNGRVAAAAVGAGIGAIAGDRIGNRPPVVSTRTVPVQSCYQVDNWQTVQTGYLVTYEYNGRQYSTVTSNHPGRYVDVNVAVAPSQEIAPPARYIETIQYNRADWDEPRRGHGGRKHFDRHHEGRYY
jgi:uncharacterized protein YcfJ